MACWERGAEECAGGEGEAREWGGRGIRVGRGGRLGILVLGMLDAQLVLGLVDECAAGGGHFFEGRVAVQTMALNFFSVAICREGK